MRCPYCDTDEDKVVDSRVAEDGRAIRRRRECLSCRRRYTTFERPEEVPLVVVKRNGVEEPFDRDKIARGLRQATKNRPVSEAALDELVEDVEEAMRARSDKRIESADVGAEVLERLRNLDEVAYLRFASVYKDFQELDDFEQELKFVKKSPPKGSD